MENKIKKAYDRLKELEIFSDDYEAFARFFYDNLKENKKDEAIELLLMVVFGLFRSEGEKFNTLLKMVSEEKKMQLQTWLENTLKGIQK